MYFKEEHEKDKKISKFILLVQYAHRNDTVEKIIFSNSMTYMEQSAIENCPNLTTLSLGNNMISFNYNKCYNTPSFSTIQVSKKNKNLAAKDGVLYNKKFTKLLYVPIASKNVKAELLLNTHAMKLLAPL